MINQELYDQVIEWADLSDRLKDIKEKELELRREIVNKVLGFRSVADYGEARKERVTIFDESGECVPVVVEVATTENMSISDPSKLLDIVQQSDFYNVTEEELKAIELKATITPARAKKLPEDSVVLDCLVFKPSPTPSLKVVEE